MPEPVTRTREVAIADPLGMHVRPASMFAMTAARFESAIQVESGGETVDGKSAISMLLLSAGPGALLSIHATGPDADAALDALESVLTRDGEPPR